MDDKDSVKPEPVGRRTRSGRTPAPVAKTTATTTRSPVQSKSTGRKTRKKMVLVEVEVSDEEEGEFLKSESGANAKSDDAACEAMSDESKEIALNSNNVTENVAEDLEESNDVREMKEELELKDLINDKTEMNDLIGINEIAEPMVNEPMAEETITNEENDTIELSDDENEETISRKDTSNRSEEMVRNEGTAINDDCIIVTENDGLFSGIEASSNGLNVIANDDIHFDKIDMNDTLLSNDEENVRNGSVDLDFCENADGSNSSQNVDDNEKHAESVEAMEIHEGEGADDNDSQDSKHITEMDGRNILDEIQTEDLANVTDENKMEIHMQDEDVIMKDDVSIKDDDVVMKDDFITKDIVKKSGIKEKDLSTEDGEVKDTSESDPMVNKLQPADPDAENISEDELPSIQVAKVPETEEVSDEELPGPKRAELPADTEVVSEDELPAVKKEGTKRKLAEGDYDPGSPTSENEVSSKKPFLDPDVEKEKEKPEKPKKLPELDKYWKAVNDDPTDFTGWTYLLQYVDQENDMEAAREAYDAFLSHYPYCYGYWRKYADYEKRKGNKKKCEEVFERGLKAIPLSVDLWIHYLTYVRTTKPEDEEFIRSQFERALSACGLEFRSDRLWDSYIKWESDGKRFQHATSIYDKLLATPTQGYTTHFENFQEHVTSNPPNKIVEVDEFLALRKEVKHMLKHDVTTEPADNPNVPPGEDSEEVSSDEETKAIRERIVSIRRKIHKNTVTSVTSRWNFEEGIKRPYFHVKPLERCQLKNWQEYLDYEIEQGDKTRIIVLFERCLIACALYEEFWLRFVHYLESLKDTELHPKIKDVYERACTIHHIKKPNLHLQWAMFEESIKNYTKAAEILVNLEKSVPNLLQVAYRRINLERRREDYEKCSQLFEHYIMNSKNKVISTNLAIKYARFCLKIMSNIEKSFEVLNTALTKDPNNPRLYLQLIDLTMQKEGVSEKEVSGYIDAFLEKENIDVEQKILFAQRKLEFLDDFGSDIQSVQKAYEEYQKLIKIGKDNKKKDVVKGDAVGKKEKNPPLPSSQASSYSNYANYSNSSGTPYQYSGSQQGQYNYSQYGQSDQYQYGSWQYPQGNYSGYNQWSGYSGGYGY